MCLSSVRPERVDQVIQSGRVFREKGDRIVELEIAAGDLYPATYGDITAAFADELRANNVDVEVVTVEGANHENVVDPTTEHGQKTLQVLAEILTNTR